MPINDVRALLWLYWLCGRLDNNVYTHVMPSPPMCRFVLAHEYMHEVFANCNDIEFTEASARHAFGLPRVIEH